MLNKELSMASTVAIGGHIRPDGDCVGSCMGLYRYIRDVYPDKKAEVYLETIPEVYQFLDGTKDIRHEIPEGKKYDLFICLDCGDADRLGFSLPLFQGAEHTLCVDHHISNQEFAEKNHIVPEASSTSELLYHLMEKDKITKETAEALYLGMVHDTGVFQYSCTAPSTMEAAAELMRKGIDSARIIEDTFFEKTYEQNQVLGRTLVKSALLLDGKCIAAYLTKEEMDSYGVDSKDLDGIVSQLRVTKGVEVAVFMYELQTGEYKVSLRSKHAIDVNRIAQFFGGGGHKKAAGFNGMGKPQEVLDPLMEQIELQLKEESQETR